VVVAGVSLALLFRFKISNPLLIACAAVIGLVAYPLIQPGWVLLK
jgi:chromate transporter